MRDRLSPRARRRIAWLAIAAAAFGLAHAQSPALERFAFGVAQARLQQAWHPAPPADASAARCPARTCPVARIIVPGQRAERIVVSQSEERAPAGGWGHLSGTPLPAATGNTVFRVYPLADARLLRSLAPGDALVVELQDARQFVYRVETVDTTDRRQARVKYDTRAAQLTLVARHPEDPGLRYVVRASRETAPIIARRPNGPRLPRST